MAPGCLGQLPEIVAGYAPEQVLLVTDPGIEETGIPERVWQGLAEREIEAITFDDVEPNPRAATVDRLAAVGARGGGRRWWSGSAAAACSTPPRPPPW